MICKERQNNTCIESNEIDLIILNCNETICNPLRQKQQAWLKNGNSEPLQLIYHRNSLAMEGESIEARFEPILHLQFSRGISQKIPITSFMLLTNESYGGIRQILLHLCCQNDQEPLPKRQTSNEIIKIGRRPITRAVFEEINEKIKKYTEQNKPK